MKPAPVEQDLVGNQALPTTSLRSGNTLEGPVRTRFSTLSCAGWISLPLLEHVLAALNEQVCTLQHALTQHSFRGSFNVTLLSGPNLLGSVGHVQNTLMCTVARSLASAASPPRTRHLTTKGEGKNSIPAKCADRSQNGGASDSRDRLISLIYDWVRFFAKRPQLPRIFMAR